MKAEILSNLDNPGQLEKLYRSDKPAFERSFKELYPELHDNSLMGYWQARLTYTKEEILWGSVTDILFVVIGALVAGTIAKFPALFHIDEQFFYSRNIGFIVFPLLTAYFAWKNKLMAGTLAVIAVPIIAGLFFINWLPDNRHSDTLVLSCIHLVLFLWAILGFAFVGGAKHTSEKRLDFLKYNGDLAVMSALIVISGGILTAITLGLFRLIGINIEQFYVDYILIYGLSAVPIVATFLTQTNPQLVGKVSPVIAKIFSPLVLVMLLIYLVAMVASGKDPYNDREFLLIFNALLVGVMALIFFSVAEGSGKSRAEIWVLLALSLVTIIVNGIALSAILFRISQWGITPNRLAILGGNGLILVNLILVTLQLFRSIGANTEVTGVRKAIESYLPVYCLWTIIVTFVFPLIFGFK